MLNPFKKLFQYTDTVSFEVSGNVTQAVNRLSLVAGKPILQATFTGELSNSSLVGIVSKDQIRLHKVTPLFGNIFKPIFFGKFQSQNGKSSLIGAFEMGAIARIVINIFIFFSLAIQIMLLPGIGTVSGLANLGLFEPLLFLCGGILLVLIIKAYSKRDIEWIKQQMERALVDNT